jgi:hypothetical protein
MSFRLFISHSSSNSRASEQRLEALQKALVAEAKPANLTVLCDRQQIAGGDDWRDRIGFMLHVCHAAIVILDEAAIESDWVLAESTFLPLRNRVDPQFQFIPVTYLEEKNSVETQERLEAARAARAAQRAQVRQGTWRVVDLDRLQYARGQQPVDVARMVVQALREKNELMAHDSPVDLLARQLTAYFRGVDAGLLDLVAEAVSKDGQQMQVPTVDLAYAEYLEGDRSIRTAMALTRHLVGLGSLTKIREAMQVLGQVFPDDYRAAILEQLSPLPLDPEAAAPLTRTRANGTGYVHASVRTSEPARTVPWYVARAYLPKRTTMLTIENADGTFESLQAALRQEWRKATPRVQGLSDNRIDQQLKKIPRYVSVPGPIAAEVLDQFDTAYPALSFVIHQTASVPPESLPPNVSPLLPVLLPDEETRMIDDYIDAFDSLG